MPDVSIKPKEKPEPTRENLRLITQRPLPPEQLIAAVRAAGFQVRSDEPHPWTASDDLGQTYDGFLYTGECQVEGIWYGVSTHGPLSPVGRIMVEVAAIHKAAEGD